MVRVVLAEELHELVVELEMVLLEVLVQQIRAQHLRDLDQLIPVAVAHEERLLLEDLHNP